MLTSFTPGPWESELNADTNIFYVGNASNPKSKITVAKIEPVFRSNEANARLISAAPELLECLIEMASGHSMAGEARARAAIEKATGKESLSTTLKVKPL